MAGSPKKRARRERAAAAADPLDEAAPRPALAPIPWNKVELTEHGREAVADALLDGYPRNQIARALGTTVKTLKRLIDNDPILGDAIEARKDAEEAELRDILMGLARQGDTVAAIFLGKSQYGWRDRGEDDSMANHKCGGVLVVPGVEDIATWSLAAEKQQAQFREAPREMVEDRAARAAQAERERTPHDGTPGIEGLRLVKPTR
jgi:hypothetical protein